MKKLFSKDTVNIAGHKVPYALLGALAAILGAVLIWQFNRNSGGAAAAADAPMTATTDLTGPGVSGNGVEGPPGPQGPPGPPGGASNIPPSAALIAWRKKHHYGSHATTAPPTTKTPTITKTA